MQRPGRLLVGRGVLSGGRGKGLCFWREAGGLARGWETLPHFPLHPEQPSGTPSVGGRPVSQNLQGGGTPVLPLLCPSSLQKMPSGRRWRGDVERPQLPTRQGPHSGDRRQDPGAKPTKPHVWLWTEEKSHHCAGENKRFSDGFKNLV